MKMKAKFDFSIAIQCTIIENSYRFVTICVSIKSSCNRSMRIQWFREICYRSDFSRNCINGRSFHRCKIKMTIWKKSTHLKYEFACSLLDLGSFAIDHITTHAWFLSRWISCSMAALWFSNNAGVKSLEMKLKRYWNGHRIQLLIPIIAQRIYHLLCISGRAFVDDHNSMLVGELHWFLRIWIMRCSVCIRSNPFN